MAKNKKINLRWYHVGVDGWLACAVFLLLLIGVIMVASSSVAVRENAYYFVDKQMVFIFIAWLIGAGLMFFSTDLIQRLNYFLLILSIVILVMTLLPHIGAGEVKGASRWIRISDKIRFQPVEAVKLALVVVMAAYVVKYKESIQNSMWGILRPLLFILLPVGFLVICQPDYGSMVLLSVITGAMIFMAGARIKDVLLLVFLGMALLLAIAYAADYRLDRFDAFFADDLWKYARNNSYQIRQALIAIGRGEMFGVGLGSGIQKLRYLPEGHNDFIFAVYAEEFGFLGILVMISLFLLLLFRIFKISKEAFDNGNDFSGFMCAGIGFWLGLQTLLSMGVNLHLLPTKGLTLPFISSGGSGILMNILAVVLVFRVSYENKSLDLQRRHVAPRESLK